MTPLLQVRDLRKQYGSLVALDSLSFDLVPGQTIALLGPNGSGKTTALRSIAGLTQADSGEIRVQGETLGRNRRDLRKFLSFLPQEPNFPSDLKVREVIEFHARLRRLGEESGKRAKQEAGLSEADLERYVGELSGGMKQRLSIAIATVSASPLMLLDEPTANLDPAAALRLRSLAKRWKSEGRALLLSTHVLSDVEELADRVIVLVGGKVAVDESVEKLKRDIRQDALLRVDLGSPSEAHIDAAMAAGAVSARMNCTTVVITAPVESRFRILERLNQVSPVRHFESEPPSVEQIYLRYVSHVDQV